eukprot:CAMPEP_0194331952 /NCGR_PEP_ID=MMETSP0171-20130528/57446_1 /TAXON_ID=218684 /ORGANISM="Corethron pennatum, Strain L29A3" /LENGTH=63 /DNA_ID=CAMNT_0039093625 /DNA_START=139 /DNA_END=327 /DNA_ORIENTATION=+
MPVRRLAHSEALPFWKGTHASLLDAQQSPVAAALRCNVIRISPPAEPPQKDIVRITGLGGFVW